MNTRLANTRRPAAVSWALAAEVTAPSVARSAAHAVATAWGLAELAGDLGLCVSELVTNAVVHGAGPVTVRLSREPDELLLCEVSDEGPGSPRACEPGPAAERGRGLAIVAALAATWGVRSGGCHGERNGKTVWFCLEGGV